MIKHLCALTFITHHNEKLLHTLSTTHSQCTAHKWAGNALRGQPEAELHHKHDRQRGRKGNTSVHSSGVLAGLSSAPFLHLVFNSGYTEGAESPNPHVNLAKEEQEPPGMKQQSSSAGKNNHFRSHMHLFMFCLTSNVWLRSPAEHYVMFRKVRKPALGCFHTRIQSGGYRNIWFGSASRCTKSSKAVSCSSTVAWN